MSVVVVDDCSVFTVVSVFTKCAKCFGGGFGAVIFSVTNFGGPFVLIYSRAQDPPLAEAADLSWP